MYIAAVVLFAAFYGLARETADRAAHRGYERWLGGSWDQFCTQAAGYRLHDPCSASRWCRENRFNDAMERFILEGTDYDGVAPQ